MRKIVTLIVLSSLFLTGAYANNDLDKEKNNEKKSFKTFQNSYTPSGNNWFASVGVGAQIFFGDHDKQLGTGKRITPAFDLSVGRWFDSSFGVRVNAQVSQMKGLTQYGESNGLSTGKLFREYDDLWYQKFTYLNAHADLLFNWTDDIYGGAAERMYNLIPYVGVGFISVFDKQKGTSVSGNIGFINSFKVNDKWSIMVDVKGSAFRDKVDGEIGGRNFDGILSVKAGVSYGF